jgi:hypothetical protein
MATIAAVVEVAVKAAGVPILGVSIGDPGNRTTWRVDFDPSATAAHKATAATVVSTVAVDSAALAAQDEKDAQAQVDLMRIDLKAVVLTLLDEINLLRAAVVPALPQRSATQALAAIRAKAGTL